MTGSKHFDKKLFLRILTLVVSSLLAVFLMSCDQDPARSVKIISRPLKVIPPDTEVAPKNPKNVKWSPPGCPPFLEKTKGLSTFRANGPCTFTQTGGGDCEILNDDFIISASRNGPHGTKIMVYVNVENYKGPGKYFAGQIFVGVQDQKEIYRWSSDTMPVTVPKDEGSIVIPTLRLEAEPRMINCSGEMTNFQCNGHDTISPMVDSIEEISGTIVCGTTKRSN